MQTFSSVSVKLTKIKLFMCLLKLIVKAFFNWDDSSAFGDDSFLNFLKSDFENATSEHTQTWTKTSVFFSSYLDQSWHGPGSDEKPEVQKR